MQHFDVETKTWKPLPSMAQLTEANKCCCAEYVGNYLYVAAKKGNDFVNYRYDTVSNSWETLPPVLSRVFSTSHIDSLCSVEDYLYVITSGSMCVPFRYSPAKNNWQGGASLGFVKKQFEEDPNIRLTNATAAVWESHIFVLHGLKKAENRIGPSNPSTRSSFGGFQFGTQNINFIQFWAEKEAVLHCFDPKTNEWKQQSSTCRPHCNSSLFVINNRLYVADSCNPESVLIPSVEVYDENNDSWSIVEQKHIPPNNLGAVEIEGRVYFIINKFPVDSGIRIPPDEIYHVHLDEWENLAKIHNEAVLCYLPVKRESLET